LTFDHPDRIPIDAGLLPAAWTRHGQKLVDLWIKADVDIAWLPFHDPTQDVRQYQAGSFRDVWGCKWVNHQEGISGQVKEFPIDEYGKLQSYQSPVHLLRAVAHDSACAEFCIHNRNKFIRGGWVSLFERMQFLRGTENLLMDIADECPHIRDLLDIVMEFCTEYLQKIMAYDVDAITIGDDWGTQRGLLISPETWRAVFRPAYQKLIDMAKAKGKYIFFHSDGYILDLFDDLVEMGVDAINSQIWCMGLDKVSAYKGKICFWGEISRQTTLPFGTPQDVHDAAAQMKNKLTVNGGGLIAQSELDSITPFDNIVAFFNAWN